MGVSSNEDVTPEVIDANPRDLAARVLRLSRPPRRTIIGITGPPGTGKSTLVRQIVNELPAEARAAVVPMDGFHFSTAILRSLGRESRKGAIDTFDAAAFAVLMERLRTQTGGPVYAPDFDHGIGEPIAASIVVPEDAVIVLTEGNYLLSDQASWKRARAVLDEVWYLRTPRQTRIERLIARHVASGKSLEAATEWANGSDERNARLIAQSARNADLILNA